MKTGATLIAQERARQIAVEGYSPAHDDAHEKSELAFAAAAYTLADESHWPWALATFKPTPPTSDAIRDLVKAGALLAAEIDRLQRLAKPKRKKQMSLPFTE